jgi:hypothetical protein
LIGFVGNNPFSYFDPDGRYELQYEWFAFSRTDRDYLESNLQVVGRRADELSDQISMYFTMSAWNNCCLPLYDKHNRLRDVFRSIAIGVASTSENLEVKLKDIGGADGRMAEMGGFSPFIPDSWDMMLYGYDPVLVLNSNPNRNWRLMPQSDFQETLLHEFSHIYGTEDSDEEGILFNAETITPLMQIDIYEWPPINRLLRGCGFSIPAIR